MKLIPFFARLGEIQAKAMVFSAKQKLKGKEGEVNKKEFQDFKDTVKDLDKLITEVKSSNMRVDIAKLELMQNQLNDGIKYFEDNFELNKENFYVPKKNGGENGK